MRCQPTSTQTTAKIEAWKIVRARVSSSIASLAPAPRITSVWPANAREHEGDDDPPGPSGPRLVDRDRGPGPASRLLLFVALPLGLALAPAAPARAQGQEPPEPASMLEERGERERDATDLVEEALIANEVRLALIRQLDIEGMDIDIDIDDGHVVLTGIVERREVRELAGEVARRVEGIESVDNWLLLSKQARARGSMSERALAEARRELEDTELATEVMRALLDELKHNALAIEIDAASGHVLLSGWVDDEAAKKRALEAARRVEKVEQVGGADLLIGE